MKKIILMLAVLFALGVKQADAQRLSFYFYPSANVYYNVASHDYIYYDAGSWVTVRTLPATIVINRTPRYTVYYNGPEVWRDNGLHKGRYKGRKVGPYKGNKGNKGKGRG
jgi:hypothetical protein